MKQPLLIDLPVDQLKKIAYAIQSKTAYGAIPSWVFDLERYGQELSVTFKEHSRLLGYSGNTKQRPPELEKLRMAIVKIGSLCVSGGFAFSRDSISEVLLSAAGDLEEYSKENPLNIDHHAK